MTDKTKPSLQLDDTEILLLKEKEEKSILKETLSQKDETIENLKRCLQLYQNGFKEYPFNVDAGQNITECVEEIDDFKESFTKNHRILTTGHSEVKLDDIIIDDDVDDLVNFVNKDFLGEEHFLKELDVSFDVDGEIVKLEDNIDINDLATFSGLSFGGLSEEYSNDDVVSEIMSSPLDGFSLKCVENNVKESVDSNGETFNRNSLVSSLPETKTTAIRKSTTGKSMKMLIPREFLSETTADDEVMTVEDELLDILDSSSETCGGVPPLEKMALKAPTKETLKGRIKRQSDICVNDSSKKWLVENKHYKVDKQSSRKRKNLSLESSTQKYGKKDYTSEPLKLKKKASQSVQSNNGGKDTADTALYRMVDCSKCGVAFPMDRTQIINSFYKPGSPRCSHCQTSPKEKGEKSKSNFMSRTKLGTGQTSEKMENYIKNCHDKMNPFSAQSFHQTARKVATNKSHIQCEVCGKQFPMGGEWKYKKHMDVHVKGKRQATANVDVKIHPVEIITESKKPVEVKGELKKCEEDIIEMKKGEDAILEMKIMKDQVEEKGHVKGKQKANTCDVCQESFKYKSTLLAHMKTHKSSFPFRCNLCNKFFKQIDDMVDHGVLEHNKRSVGKLLALLGRGTN